MEKHGGACDEKHLAELSAYAAKNLKPFGFDFIQIDDGWQDGITANGPKKNFTTHAARRPLSRRHEGHGGQASTSSGSRPASGSCRSPAITRTRTSRITRTGSPRDPDGKPYETDWGGTCLDMTHPGAREYVRDVVERIAHDWGYRLFKMDGFWTGSATPADLRQRRLPGRRHRRGRRSPTRTRPTSRPCATGRSWCARPPGRMSSCLGCCVSQNMRSFGGSFGLLDAMRVGPDTGAGHIGAPHASRLWFLNGRVWWNDPDCVSVRAAHAAGAGAAERLVHRHRRRSVLQQRLDARLPARAAGHSAPLHARRTICLRGRWTCSRTSRPASGTWPTRAAAQRRDVVALYNWGKKPATISCAGRADRPAAGQGVRRLRFLGQQVRAAVQGRGAGRSARRRLLPDPGHPAGLGPPATAEHLAARYPGHGGRDRARNGTAAAATLSAASKVVAGDPLRAAHRGPRRAEVLAAAGRERLAPTTRRPASRRRSSRMGRGCGQRSPVRSAAN